MTKPIPDGYRTLTPAVFVDGGLAAIDFYQRAFGADVVRKVVVGDKVISAELRIGDSMFQLNDPLPQFGLAAPATGGGDSAAILIYTEDVDGMHARAVEAGAEVINMPEDRFHGNRSGALRDPFGHRWAIVKQVEELSEDEMLQRIKQAMA
ncbi:VOC family protein [Streptomyces sp. SID5914]|nr:VOC family protein [Streptomyces sp. SID5914]MZG13471.1 VOC family protein [Streptomyces sp. SID5914]